MAGHDPARVEEVRDWPLRELFLAYLAREKERARGQYYIDVLVWAILAPYQKHRQSPPALPKILKGS